MQIVSLNPTITVILVFLLGYNGSFRQPFEKSIDVDVNAGTVALSIYSGLFAYIGWWVTIEECTSLSLNPKDFNPAEISIERTLKNALIANLQ